jgi:transglutaminase-like putative cysteine protease
MTVPAARPVAALDLGSLPRRISLRPAEGWLTAATVALLAMTFALSIDDAGWVPVADGSTGYLVWVALAGAAVGLLGVKLGLGRWKTHLVGCIIAGLVLPALAGGIILGPEVSGFSAASIMLRYQAAGTMASQVWADLVVNGRPFTNQFGHYHILFSALVWAAGQFAATTVFARRRPLDAVVVVGLLLLANMAVTARDQLQLMILFSIAALVLLIRAHTFEEQVTWVRRRIGDPAAVSALYLRGGGAFITAAVVGSILLTATASSAPLQGLWTDLPQRLVGFSQWLQRYAPTGGDPRPLGVVGFGSSATTQGLWQPSTAIAFQATVTPSDQGLLKWRAGTYAVYDGIARWSWGDSGTITQAAGAPLLVGTGDDPAVEPGRTEFTATISPAAYDQSIVSPATIEKVDRPAVVRLDGNRFTTVESAGGSGSYAITALVPTLGGSDGVTQNRLRVAGTTYPTDIVRSYSAVPKDALGPASLAILDQVKQLASVGGKPADPFDLALAMQDYLRSSRFTYKADVRDLVSQSCNGVSTVECFARIRTGYCEYYASTMAMLLRQAQIPTRIAYGFLASAPDSTGVETVRASAAHWWVEVYFPTYGWIEFDPTGTVGQPEALPSGPPETHKPVAVGSIGPEATDPVVRPRSSPGAGGGGTTSPSSGAGPFIAIAILLLIGVGAVAVAARRRAPSRPMHPDQAWGSLGRMASRFGVGPRPAQTVYEYAGALSDAIPAVRAELSTVARAKVEVAYGRQELGIDRMRTIADAYGRLRFALLRFGIGRIRRRR